MLKILPEVLLIGAGKFGEKHLLTLLKLQDAKKIKLSGVLVRSHESVKKIARLAPNVVVYRNLSKELLESVDAVTIATPMNTHKNLVEKVLPYAHVLVEKPLTTNARDAHDLVRLARKIKRNKLMVGHIFRFDPTILQLKKMLRNNMPESIEIDFIQPEAEDSGRDIELELLHPFDIADFLFNKKLLQKYTERNKRIRIIGAKYKNGIHGVYRIGWGGDSKVRTVKITAGQKAIYANLLTQRIVVFKKGKKIQDNTIKSETTPLESEYDCFLKIISNKTKVHPNAQTGERIVEMAVRGRNNKFAKKPTVAVIGAGIFGTNCAIELAKQFDVTIFEKNSDILTEASKFNQYRHHWGYHYPRSQKTMDDIHSTTQAFEEQYEPAIIRKFPTYYSIAKNGSKVSATEYFKFCDQNNLKYKIEYPSDEYLDRKKIDTCLKTFEPIYNFELLKTITAKRLKCSNAKLRLNHEIVKAKLDRDGKKRLYIRKKNGLVERKFDYIINVTYARHNHFPNWMGFSLKPIRLDLVEMAWVKLNIPQISFAVMDGPFTNMVPTSAECIFTLVHIKHSIRKRFVAENGLVPKNFFSVKKPITEKIIHESAKWLPVIKRANLQSVNYVIRGVNAYHEHDDARTSDITEHGFGCYSILGGKIIHAVSIARDIAGRLEVQHKSK